MKVLYESQSNGSTMICTDCDNITITKINGINNPFMNNLLNIKICSKTQVATINIENKENTIDYIIEGMKNDFVDLININKR